MNINGGTISLETLLENDAVYRGLETTKNLVKNFTSLTVKSGVDIDAIYKKMADTISIGHEQAVAGYEMERNTIKNLIKVYDELEKKANKIKSSNPDEYQNLKIQQVEIKREIDQSKAIQKEYEQEGNKLLNLNQRLDDHKTKLDNASNAQVRFRTELLNVKQKMMELEAAGKQATPEYAALTEEAKRLGNAMYAVNQQVKILTSTKRAALQGVISGLSGIAGAASVAQGAVGLFADKNEELQKIMLKVQSLMAITIGLQQVSQTLHSTSAFRLTILTNIQNLYSTAVFNSGKALIKFGLSANTARIASQAFMATITLGLGVAITAAVVALNKFSNAQKKAKEEAEKLKKIQESLAKSMLEGEKSAQSEIVKLNLLYKATQDNTKGMSERKKAVKELKKSYPTYLKNFSDEEILAGKAAAAYYSLAKAIIATSIARAKQEKIQENEKKKLDLEENITKLEKENKELEVKKTKKENYDTSGSFSTTAVLIKASDIEVETRKINKNTQAISDNKTEIEELSKANKDLADSINIEDLYRDFGGSKTTSNNGKDPFTKELEDKKKAYDEYFKWINSTDENVRNSASGTFSKLLKGGGSYKEYLNNQIASLRQLQDEGKITAEQLSKLKKLTTALQDETHKTIMGEFEKGLQTELDNARSIMEMLNIIEQRRKGLETDESGLKEQKGEILDKQQEDVAKKAADETRQLLQSYSAYLDEKINFDLQYSDRKKQAEKAVADAEKALQDSNLSDLEELTDEEEKQLDLLASKLITAKAQLAGLEKDKEKYDKQTDNQDYDNLIQEYRSFEQKKIDITDEYNKKKKILEDGLNNSDITESQRTRVMQSLQELEKEYKKSLSDLSVEILEQSDTWKKLFRDLDTLTVSEMLRMKKTIEAAFENPDLSPEALKALREQLDNITGHVQEKNPFAALSDALGKYKKEQNKANFKDLLKGIAASIDFVRVAFDSVVDGLKEMGIAGDEETQKLLGDISKMAGAASNLATGIATHNPLQTIQGGISLITSAFDVFNSKDRAANRSIKKHAEAINALESAYKKLEHAIKSALGESIYKNQTAAIQNMRRQQAHLQLMWKAEQDKKKTDNNKVNEYKEQYAELGRQIEDMIAEISASITQTTAKDLANQLADALVEAYGKGEDAAKSFEEVSRKVIQNAVKNALKLQFLETPLKNTIAQLQKDMGFDSEGNGTFNGLTQAEQDRFKREIDRIGQDFNRAMEMYKDLFKDLDAGDPTTGLSGAIKGASQESITLLAGQTNAVRENQVEGIEIMRNQLIQLTLISANTGKSSKHLESIDNKIGNNSYDPLRSQGIIS